MVPEKIYFVFLHANRCLFSNPAAKISNLTHGQRITLILRLEASLTLFILGCDRLLYPSLGSNIFLEYSLQFHNIRKIERAYSSPVSLYSFLWVTSCLFKVKDSFCVTVKTGTDMTWPWYITLVISLLCVKSKNKGILFEHYQNSPEPTKKLLIKNVSFKTKSLQNIA